MKKRDDALSYVLLGFTWGLVIGAILATHFGHHR